MKLEKEKLKKLKGSRDFEYIRQILIELKKGNLVSSDYNEYQEYLKKFLHYRFQMKTEYICNPSLNPKGSDIVNVIIKKAIRKILSCFEDQFSNMDQIDATNNCIPFSFIVKSICDELGISSDIIEIWPGYDARARIFGLQGFHYCNIIHLENKSYLIDLSYKQFFKKSHSFLEEIGVIGLCAPLPGIFMLLNKERRKVAMELLRNGFIELKGNNLKLYCDGFTLSYRNGLYYQTFGDKYITNYTNQDYMNFLFYKNDNQINHEPIKYLGPLIKD